MMSVFVSYYFNWKDAASDKSLASIASVINKVVGCSLRPLEQDETHYFALHYSFEISLGRNAEPLNDGELEFEEYEFFLDSRTSAGAAETRPLQTPAMATLAMVLFAECGISGMLVYDSGVLLARYSAQDLLPDYVLPVGSIIWNSPQGKILMFDDLTHQPVSTGEEFSRISRLVPTGHL